eukprot:tig00021318_g20164.t1
MDTSVPSIAICLGVCEFIYAPVRLTLKDSDVKLYQEVTGVQASKPSKAAADAVAKGAAIMYAISELQNEGALPRGTSDLGVTLAILVKKGREKELTEAEWKQQVREVRATPRATP